MKKIINIIAGASVILLAASCDDFLNIRVEGTMPSSGTDYTKAENIFQPVSAAYAQMRGDIWFPYICVGDVSSDDSDTGSAVGDNAYATAMNNYTFDPGNYMFNSLWTGYYNIISAANNAIYQEGKYAEAMKTEENKLYARQCANEAKLIRAFAYTWLYRTFGEVPIVRHGMTSDELADNPQVKKDELYKYILQDLDEAIDTLPASYSKNWGTRYTKYTALALKAKAAMYFGDWKGAADAAGEDIASGKISLVDDYRFLFSVDGEGCSESLMEIEGSDLGQNSGEAPYLLYAYYQGPRNNSPSNMQGWGFNVPNDNLKAFLSGRGDAKRISITYLERGTTTPEGDYISDKCPNPYYNGKVYTPSSYNTFNTNAYGYDHNIRLIRYAEVLLIYAEALANGKSTDKCTLSADDALHQVQNRAGIATTAASLQNIWDERRAELALENNRIFDLIRLGKVGEVVGEKIPAAKTNFHSFFPIPSEQITLNKALVPSPGYVY